MRWSIGRLRRAKPTRTWCWSSARDPHTTCWWPACGPHWQHDDETLDSFAAITDAPPADIAAAGHDRCIVPIKAAHTDAWLDPDSHPLPALQAILDDREPMHYVHRLAA